MVSFIRFFHLGSALLLTLAHSGPAYSAPPPDLFYKALTRPVARLLFEGDGAARELVVARMGQPIWDFRGGDAYRFRMRFEGVERDQLQSAIERIDERLIQILRTGVAIDGPVLVRSLAEQELLAVFADSQKVRFLEKPSISPQGDYKSARRDFVQQHDAQLDEIVNMLKLNESLRGLIAPGVNLGAITDRSIQLIPRDLQGADLRFAQIESSELLGGANLRGAKLDYAMMSSSNLRNANLEYASLVGAELRSARFNGTRLGHADLHEADLRGVDLRYARDWNTAQFHGAIYDEATRLPFSSREAQRLGMKVVTLSSPSPR